MQARGVRRDQNSIKSCPLRNANDRASAPFTVNPSERIDLCQRHGITRAVHSEALHVKRVKGMINKCNQVVPLCLGGISLAMALLTGGPPAALAQNLPFLYRADSIPQGCGERCEEQKKFLETLDEFTPVARLQQVFGPPFKIITTAPFIMTWYAGEHVDLFVIKSRLNEKTIGVAQFVPGLQYNQQSSGRYIPTPFWGRDKTEMLTDISMADAIEWAREQQGGEEKRNDRLLFTNAKFDIAWTPRLNRGKFSGYKTFSLLFPMGGAECNRNVGDEDIFILLRCDKAKQTIASGIFIDLRPYETISDEHFKSVLGLVWNYFLWGRVALNEAEPSNGNGVLPPLVESSSLSLWAIGTSSNCNVPKKLYTLSLDGGTITWRDGVGNIDIETIVSSGPTEFTSQTLRSIHTSGRGEPPGTTWHYSKTGADRIRVKPGGRDSFMLVRCPG